MGNEKCETSEVVDDHEQLICDDRGAVIIPIQEILKQRCRVHGDESNIYRVPKQLREMNHKAYVPQLISIGPFHHDSVDLLGGNNQYKLQSLDNFLHRMDEKEPLKLLIKAAECWVEKARNCYGEPMDDMKDDEFVKMMFVDGCFIVEFMTLHNKPSWWLLSLIKPKSVVTLSSYLGIMPGIYLELIKLENQVPLFVLEDLFDLLPNSSKLGSNSILKLLDSVPISGFLHNYKLPDDLPRKPNHLTDYLRIYFLPMHLLWKDDDEHKQAAEQNCTCLKQFGTSMRLLWHNCVPKIRKKMNNFLSFFINYFNYMRLLWHKCVLKISGKKYINIVRIIETLHSGPLPLALRKRYHKSSERLIPPSLSELSEAGVTIKIANNLKCITNISFNNGVLEIPPLHIDDSFEPIMRNLLASEHFSTSSKVESEELYVLHYMFFMDDLITTEKDVSLLVKAGVLINNIGGSHKEVSELFNNLCKFVMYPTSSRYDDISKDLRKHCDGWWNKSKASLKRDYFNTPWGFVSVIAATFLIVLTILQTIFTAISTFP